MEINRVLLPVVPILQRSKNPAYGWIHRKEAGINRKTVAKLEDHLVKEALYMVEQQLVVAGKSAPGFHHLTDFPHTQNLFVADAGNESPLSLGQAVGVKFDADAVQHIADAIQDR